MTTNRDNDKCDYLFTKCGLKLYKKKEKTKKKKTSKEFLSMCMAANRFPFMYFVRDTIICAFCRPLLYICKAILGRGQPGLIR